MPGSQRARRKAACHNFEKPIVELVATQLSAKGATRGKRRQARNLAPAQDSEDGDSYGTVTATPPSEGAWLAEYPQVDARGGMQTSLYIGQGHIDPAVQTLVLRSGDQYLRGLGCLVQLSPMGSRGTVKHPRRVVLRRSS